MKRAILGTIVALLAIALAATAVTGGDNIPSSKAAATSSAIMTVPATSGSPGTEILKAQIKTAEQKELVITVSAESVLMTTENTSGPAVPPPPGVSSSSATARLIVAVVVDDVMARPGSITWNDRMMQEQHTLIPGHSDYLYESTRSSNSFTFLAINVGAGTHTVTVLAWREGYASGPSGTNWVAYVGKRTLVVEETQMAKPVEPAVDATFPVVTGSGSARFLTFNGYVWLGDHQSAQVYAEWGTTPFPPSGPIPFPPFPYTIGPLTVTSDAAISFGPTSVTLSGPTIYWWRVKLVCDAGTFYSPMVGTAVTP